MTDNAIRQEILDVWVEVTNSSFPNASRVDVTHEMEHAERLAASDAEQHLGLWLALTDKPLHLLMLLYQFAEENVEKVPAERGRSAAAFRSLLARLCALTVAIRRLVVTGLEEAARLIMRLWLETLDLAIVLLADEDFATRFTSAVTDADYDANELWKAEIRYGRLNRRLERVLAKAEMSREQIEHSLGDRKLTKGKLSESVHSSLPSAMFSEAIPSLSSPGFYNRSLLGSVSSNSPDLLSLIIEYVHEFGVIFHKLLTSSRPPPLLNNTKSFVGRSSLHVGFFTLQEMMERYCGMLPPSSSLSDATND